MLCVLRLESNIHDQIVFACDSPLRPAWGVNLCRIASIVRFSVGAGEGPS